MSPMLTLLLALSAAPQEASATVVPARIRAAREIVLSAEVGGRVEAREASRSSRVMRGELILEIDPTFHRLACEAARAGLEKAQVERDFAEREQKRVRLMAESGSATPNARERAELDFQLATVAVRAAEIALRQAEERLSRTRILAPEDGAVVEIHLEIGELVAPGTPVAKLLTVDELVAEAFVAPEQLAAFPVDAPVQVRFDAPGSPGIVARVREVAPAADAQRTFRVVVPLPEAPSGVLAGFSATLEALESR